MEDVLLDMPVHLLGTFCQTILNVAHTYLPRQPAYEIKLMLSRVPWELAQISCYFLAPVF